MKKLIIPVLLIALAFSQSCKDKNTSTEENSAEQEVVASPANESQKQEIDSTTIILNKYEPKNQRNIPIEENDNYIRKHKLKREENSFDIEKKTINVIIPNSHKDMRIINVFNISDYSNGKSYNAIVINIYNGIPNATDDEVTHKLKAEIEMEKITGLNLENLKDNKLKVYIINDNAIDKDAIEKFKQCASKETEYSYKECDLRCGELYEQCRTVDCSEWNDGCEKCNDDVNVQVPREQEGDIIPPTGG